MTVKLGHKCLAETHDFSVALTCGIKVRTALAAAHGQAGQAVLEYLLKAKEPDNARINVSLETETALVRTDSRVELNSVASVGAGNACVINPCNTE